jgi:hypothetical protein
MTKQEIFAAVSAVISAGLDADYWAEQQTRQEAAFNTALGDILARLPGVKADDLTADNTNVLYAIAEQAVYLLRNYGSQTSGTAVTSESVDGLAVAYGVIGKSDGIISPRAMAYLDAAIAEIRAGKAANVRFVRG